MAQIHRFVARCYLTVTQCNFSLISTVYALYQCDGMTDTPEDLYLHVAVLSNVASSKFDEVMFSPTTKSGFLTRLPQV